MTTKKNVTAKHRMESLEQIISTRVTWKDVLHEQLQNTPWWLTSVALHLVAGLMLMIILTGSPRRDPENIMIVSSQPETEPVNTKRKERQKEKIGKTIDKPPTKINDPGEEPPPPEGTKTGGLPLTPPLEDDPEITIPTNFEANLVTMPKNGVPGRTFKGFKGLGNLPGGTPFGEAKRKMKKSPERVPQSQKAVELALRWLAENQESDGSWQLNPTEKTAGNEALHYRIAVTGFALAAFTGDGHSEKHGKYRSVIRKALDYLKSVQTGEGAFSTNMYAHGIATLGVAECVAMGGSQESRAMLLAAIQNAADRQNKLGGWGYSGPEFSDSSVTGFMAQAIHSAMYDKKMSRNSVVVETWDKIMSCFHHMRGKDGSTGYRSPGGGSVRLRAVGGIMALFNNEGADDLWVQKAAEGLPKSPQLSDMYGTYYQTLVKFQMLGARKNKIQYRAEWDQWRAGLGQLIETQEKNGINTGSWKFSKSYGNIWGRSGDTAISCLCLELRYPISHGKN